MKPQKIEPALLEKIDQGGSESLHPLPVFLVMEDNERQTGTISVEGRRYGGTPLIYCTINQSEIRAFSDNRAVNFIWDANAAISIAPFQVERSGQPTDVRSIVFDPDDEDHPIDGDRLLGQGIKCAIIDTAADRYHQDLSQRIEKVKDCTDDNNFDSGDQSHSTHVAGIVAQLAPEARLYLYKIFNHNGMATRKFVVDAIMAAVRDGVDVINGSWGESGCHGGCPQDLAVSYACSQGILFCGSAGNSGPDPMSLTCPAGNEDVITIGACSCDGKVADFSSKGPGYKNNDQKPDIAAPGVDISSCRPGGGYQRFSGTSMAAPVLAGSCAVAKSVMQKSAYYQQNNISGIHLQIKKAIIHQGRDLGFDRFHQGAGILDLNATLKDLSVSGQSVLRFNFRKDFILRWAAAAVFSMAVLFALSYGFGKRAPADITTDSMAHAVPLFREMKELQQSHVVAERQSISADSRSSLDQHGKMFSKIIVTLGEVEQIAKQEERR